MKNVPQYLLCPQNILCVKYHENNAVLIIKTELH
jgi:hypothetical protein